MKISLQKAVGRGYVDFWNTKARYRVCKGSRGSKKSKTTALNMIYRLFQYPESNGLCVRRFFKHFARFRVFGFEMGYS